MKLADIIFDDTCKKNAQISFIFGLTLAKLHIIICDLIKQNESDIRDIDF